MKKTIVVGAIALAGLMNATGLAHADDILTTDASGIPWSWATEGDCLADGPAMVSDDPVMDVVYPFWYCDQGVSGLWYLYNTDTAR